MRCRGHQRSVFRVDAAAVDRRTGNVLAQALLEGCGIDLDLELAGGDVDVDDVALMDGGDGPAERGFGRDMTDHETAGCAAESSIGDECDAAAETLADDSRGNPEHLPHAGTALGTFIANYHHVSAANCLCGDGVHGFLFTFKDARRTGMAEALVAADFGDAALRSDVAAQDDEAAGLLQRLI